MALRWQITEMTLYFWIEMNGMDGKRREWKRKEGRRVCWMMKEEGEIKTVDNRKEEHHLL